MKLTAVISATVGLFAIVGGLYAFDCNYTRASDHKQLERRVDRREMYEDARELQKRQWDLQKHYGEDKGRKTQEYKELEAQRQRILRELNR